MKTKFCFVFAIAAHIVMSVLCVLCLADTTPGTIADVILTRLDIFLMTLYSTLMLLFFSKYYMDYRFGKYKSFSKAILITYVVALLIYVIDPTSITNIILIGITYAIGGFFMIYVVPSSIREGYTFISIYRTLYVFSTLGATMSVLVFFYSHKLGNIGMLASSILALLACVYYRNNYAK